MNLIKRILFLIFPLVLATGCSDNPSPDEPDHTPDPVRRTVLVYMVAANNLNYAFNYDNEDINEMIEGASEIAPDARWMIYHAPYYGYAPRLMELCNGDTVTLKQYEKGGSATLARMNEVLDDVARIAPAASYGMVLWSHASGYIVNGLDEELPDIPYDVKPLSFGNDYGERMNISTLRAAIKSRGIDYLYFDCCNMGCIEVAYELRDATNFIVFGPAETPGPGMPYHKNMGFLTDGSKNALIDAARTTFETYNGYTDDCTMTVVDVTGLNRLAKATAAIYDFTDLPHPGEFVTNYYGTTRYGNYIDFGEYVNALAENEGIDSSEFNAAMDQTVIYKDAPEVFYSDAKKRYLRIYTASGLATYVFNNPADFTENNYDSLQWAKDVVSHHPALR